MAPAHPLWERKWGTPLVLEATSLVLGLLVATEALSVLENLRRIAPGLALWERLRGLLRRD
ncbi:hypothetical protein [Thermus sp. NMX2.A1]|uniref:hypothetical protein n=1 Tax=Thermus sp. NMX2.A1 TaxID=570924 RepID=UPI0003DDCC96|nr:hypothetical protein [Thermus sp. NMX2.A1]ETN89123.1 hypothetical protein TNMX_03485 [Thermus sp. NMX2.A1]